MFVLVKKISPAKDIEILARGVCVKDGFVLLCHTQGANNTYLPGGHVEKGEGAAAALEREMAEECGCCARAGRFLGVVEHGFIQKSRLHFEINLLFFIDIPGFSARRPVKAKESHLDFLWHPVSCLELVRLEPVVLCRILKAWLDPAFGGQRFARCGLLDGK